MHQSAHNLCREVRNGAAGNSCIGSLNGRQVPCKSVRQRRREQRCWRVAAGARKARHSQHEESSHHFDQEVITFFTAEGIVKVPGRRLFRPRKQVSSPLPTWEEQGLCIGSTFWVAATNGLDPARRLYVYGFCRSIEQLYAEVEDTVLRRGGEVTLRDSELRSGVHESLKLTVAIPMLWGVPPEHETLSSAIKSGGGVVERVIREWQMF